MENTGRSNPIESIMNTTMENLKDMIDVNVVVGDAVETGAGATIIPISRVSFGFVAGGGEYGAQPSAPKLPFAGGTGTGVSVNPMGFLVVSEGQIKLLPAQYYAPIDRIIELLPDMLGELKQKLRGGKCVRGSGKPDFSDIRRQSAPDNMFLTPDNMPCDVSDETSRNLYPSNQGSFEDPEVQRRMQQRDETNQ